MLGKADLKMTLTFFAKKPCNPPSLACFQGYKVKVDVGMYVFQYVEQGLHTYSFLTFVKW